MKGSYEIEQLKVMLGQIPDPREARGKRHALVDVLFIALVAMVAGADGADGMEDFGDAHEDWFRQFLPLEHGIPSQDTFLRVFATLEPDALGTIFREWVAGGWRKTHGEGHVALDGKTIRRSFDTASGGKAIHMVSAWLSEDGLVLGQVAVKEKSNEIKAIPELLRLLDVRGTTVTIDAMGCQRAIAEQIVDSDADYILAVKDNQPTLRGNIVSCFADADRDSRPMDDPAPEVDVASETDAGHGRVEERLCRLIRDLAWVEQRDNWKGLSAIAEVVAIRTDKSSGKTSAELRYYIVSSATAGAADVLHAVRSHWGIENRLHWVLDVTFAEDFSRIRAGHAAKNLAVLPAHRPQSPACSAAADVQTVQEVEHRWAASTLRMGPRLPVYGTGGSKGGVADFATALGVP